MKKIIFIFAVVLMMSLPVISQAQENPTAAGNLEFNIGDIFYYSQELDVDVSGSTEGGSTWGLFNTDNFYIGYFVIDNLSLGISAELKSWVPAGSPDDESGSLSAAPLIRFYVPISSELLVNASATFIYTWGNYSAGGSETTTTQMGFGGSLGLTYMMSSNIGIGFDMNYKRLFDQKTDGDTVKDTGKKFISGSFSFKIFI